MEIINDINNNHLLNISSSLLFTKISFTVIPRQKIKIEIILNTNFFLKSIIFNLFSTTSY